MHWLKAEEEEIDNCILCGDEFVPGDTGNELGFCEECQENPDFPYDLDAYYKDYDANKVVFKGFETMDRGILEPYRKKDIKATSQQTQLDFFNEGVLFSHLEGLFENSGLVVSDVRVDVGKTEFDRYTGDLDVLVTFDSLAYGGELPKKFTEIFDKMAVQLKANGWRTSFHNDREVVFQYEDVVDENGDQILSVKAAEEPVNFGDLKIGEKFRNVEGKVYEKINDSVGIYYDPMTPRTEEEIVGSRRLFHTDTKVYRGE